MVVWCKVSLADEGRSEGAIARLVVGGGGSVSAYPVTAFVPAGLGAVAGGGRRIAFIKLDVEGFELHGMVSAFGLFGDPAAAGGAGVPVPSPCAVAVEPNLSWPAT